MSHLLAPGTFLLAAPRLRDPNFMHSVVLMLRHEEDGAFGLCVNRPRGTTLRDIVPEHAELGELPFPVHDGGPVGLDTMQLVHRAPDAIFGGHEILDGLWVGGDLDAVARFAADAPDGPSRLRFLVGYSGWGEGQLEGELATGSWVPCPADLDLVFSADDPEVVWRRALRSLGDEGAGLASMPPDPSWN